MEVVRCPSAAEFLRLTTTYRAVEPIRTNILGSVATSVMNGTQRYDGSWWWLIRAEDGEVVGAAMRTTPFGMQIGPMPDEAAPPPSAGQQGAASAPLGFRIREHRPAVSRLLPEGHGARASEPEQGAMRRHL